MNTFKMSILAIFLIALLAITPAVSALTFGEWQMGDYYSDDTTFTFNVSMLDGCYHFNPSDHTGCDAMYGDGSWGTWFLDPYITEADSNLIFTNSPSNEIHDAAYQGLSLNLIPPPLHNQQIIIEGQLLPYGGNSFVLSWNYNAGTRPSDKNFTINVKSTTSGLNIPRADVTLDLGDGSSVSGQTDLNGNATFLLVTSGGSGVPVSISKAGYNPLSSTATAPGIENYQSFNLDDITWDGGSAQLYVDILDKTTKTGISSATVGIQNQTATVDQWTYSTVAGTTAEFTKTGVFNLSVGQTVGISAFKTGEYEAADTEYTLSSAISHTSIELERVVPPENTTGSYFFPVTIVDSTNNAAISNSELSSALSETGSLVFHNVTSTTGKFNVSGTGAYGENGLSLGDILIWEGHATGYQTNGYAISVTSTNSGTTQYIPLVPNALSPISGQFVAQVSVYDDRTTAALSGVALGLNTGTVKTSSSSGTASFMNLTAGTSYTLTASKSGYTTLTKTITGGSAKVVYVDVPMSATSVNPTVQPTATGTGGISGSGTAASDQDISDWLRKNIMGILSFLVFVFLLLMGATVLRAWGIIK